MSILFLLEAPNVTYIHVGISGIKTQSTKPHETEMWYLVRSHFFEGMKV